MSESLTKKGTAIVVAVFLLCLGSYLAVAELNRRSLEELEPKETRAPGFPRGGHGMKSDDKTQLLMDITNGKFDKALELLEANPEVASTQYSTGGTPLMLALVCDKVDERRKPVLVKRLIELGADVNAKDDSGLSAAHFVRSVATAKILLKAGADMLALDDDGMSSLHEVETLELAKFFIAQGVSVESLTKQNETPLMFQAARGNTELVEFYVSRGAEVNRVDTELALSVLALALPDAAMVKLLLSHGADPNLKSPGGRSALEEVRHQLAQHDSDLAEVKKPGGLEEWRQQVLEALARKKEGNLACLELIEAAAAKSSTTR